MDFTSRLGDRSTQAHINYQCPCGCVAGLTYDQEEGAEHLGTCCCGRLLWVGPDAAETVQRNYESTKSYTLDAGQVKLPWGGAVATALATPDDAFARENARREAGKSLTKVVDPVCRMMFYPDDAAKTSTYQRATYYFCSAACARQFDANPKAFVLAKGLLARLLGR